MSLLFSSMVIITALLYFFVTPDIARNRHLALRAFLAIAAGVGSFILLYFLQLPFTGFNILLWLSINAATALCLNSALTNNLRGLHISAFALGLIIFLWIFGITVLSAMTATQLAAAPNVTVVSGPSDIINSSHIRLVSYETARWRSDKVIGSLGYKSEITEPDIQTLNGTLVWITPLDYSGFLIKAWSYAHEGTGGYVIVNAEDPKAEAQLVPVNHMIYTRYALLGNEVNRRVWEQHPEYLQMETTFQLCSTGASVNDRLALPPSIPLPGMWSSTTSANNLHGSSVCGARPQPKTGLDGGAVISSAGGTPFWNSAMSRSSPVLTGLMYFS
jgi:hypothetical protein